MTVVREGENTSLDWHPGSTDRLGTVSGQSREFVYGALSGSVADRAAVRRKLKLIMSTEGHVSSAAVDKTWHQGLAGAINASPVEFARSFGHNIGDPDSRTPQPGCLARGRPRMWCESHWWLSPHEPDWTAAGPIS